MRQLIGVLGMCSLFLLAGCTTVRGPSPEEAAHAFFLRNNQAAKIEMADWQVNAVRPFGETHLVLASYTMIDTSTQQRGLAIAYAEVAQGLGSWSVVRGQSASGGPAPPFAMYTTDHMDHTVLVYGRILSPNVHAVEATFASGEVVCDAGSNSSFALAAPGGG